MSGPTRRAVLAGGGAALLMTRPVRASAGDAETHGLSSFGDLALPPDFKHFSYVDPAAPKRGQLSLQIKSTTGNQNFDTFDTLNIYVFKGDGAAGMDATFDSLMLASGDEPDSAYGLLARAVTVAADKLAYRFLLRPEARFHDGSPVTARDVAFSLTALKEKGHPTFRAVLADLAAAEAESDHVAAIRFVPDRSRDAHLTVAAMPIFSEAWWRERDFESSTLEAPLGSGPYRVARFEPGRFIEFGRVPDYWARDLPVRIGTANFDRLRYEYFRDRQVAFEAFKSGVFNYQEEYTSRIWATGYDFPAIHDGRVRKETLPNGAPVPSQGWYFNTRRDAFKDPRVREAIGLAFDFAWTNRNIMFGFYRRTESFFENSSMKATGRPGPEELALLEPLRGKVPAEVFGEPYVPPVSDGSGSDRALLRRADTLLREAGCRRDGGALMRPDGRPFEIEFLDFQAALQPHTQPFQENLKRLGIRAFSRIVDAAQYRRRMDEYDFDMASMALGGSATPGDDLKVVFGSKQGQAPGSRNIAGIADPAVDTLIDRIAKAKTREDLTFACRALDRVLRAGRYWIPMWYRSDSWVAHWDVFSRPGTAPKFGTGAPGTWWWDEDKAKRIGRG